MAGETMGIQKRQIGTILFMTSAMMTLDAYSTFLSSPWTAENFGADDEKTDSMREYLRHAIVYSTAYSVASSAMSESVMPVLGAAISNAYLYWLYQRAAARGKASGSKGWVNDTQEGEQDNED